MLPVDIIFGCKKKYFLCAEIFLKVMYFIAYSVCIGRKNEGGKFKPIDMSLLKNLGYTCLGTVQPRTYARKNEI